MSLTPSGERGGVAKHVGVKAGQPGEEVAVPQCGVQTVVARALSAVTHPRSGGVGQQVPRRSRR